MHLLEKKSSDGEKLDEEKKQCLLEDVLGDEKESPKASPKPESKKNLVIANNEDHISNSSTPFENEKIQRIEEKKKN